MDVKVIAERYRDRPKTDPALRVFDLADHIVVKDEKLGSSRIYVGDQFRAVMNTLKPGQAQEVHMHPSTDHAWFFVAGAGEVTMEDGKVEKVGVGKFVVHPRNTVHGLKNTGTEVLSYIALSTGD